jgi:hypothetical protein
MERPHRALIAGSVVLLVAGAAAFTFWWLRGRNDAAPEATQSPAAVAIAPPAAAPVAPAASAPAIQHPIEAIETADGPPDAATLLDELFGKKAVGSLFLVDGFALRVAATVDNLGRATATPRLWPVRPTDGRFSVESRGGATFIAADNGLRYAPLLLAVESADAARVALAYKRLYPQIQKAYEDLGYPDGYFNDRLVEVIDTMLATPERKGPLEVRLPKSGDDSTPARPWLLYEFADPQLAALPAGQKLLLRMGPVDERRVKARLVEFRKLIAPPLAGR